MLSELGPGLIKNNSEAFYNLQASDKTVWK